MNDQEIKDLFLRHPLAAVREVNKQNESLRADIEAKDAELDKTLELFRERGDRIAALELELAATHERARALDRNLTIKSDELASTQDMASAIASELLEARREWRDLALLVAQSLDPECAEAEWSDIPDFDPWDCLRKAAADLAEARDELSIERGETTRERIDHPERFDPESRDYWQCEYCSQYLDMDGSCPEGCGPTQTRAAIDEAGSADKSADQQRQTRKESK